jgi:thiosulfate reductase/polysulfide reductase chain A
MAAAPQAIYYQGRRSTWGKNDFQLRRAMALFTALGGGVDVKGGIVFGNKLPLAKHEINAPLYANAESRIEGDAAAIIGASGSWVAWRDMVEAGEAPYPIRGMFVYKHNPMLSVPDTAKTKKMFEKMDLVVVIDTMPSDTALMADVILPECSYLEREDPVKTFPGIEPVIGLRKKVIEPMYDSKPVIEIMRGLSKTLTKPLWEITKKHDEDVQDELEDEDELSYYQENGFDLTAPYLHSQEELNHHAFAVKHGEAAWKTLRETGVYYPGMDTSFKKINNNSYQYYPEDKKVYSVLPIEEKTDLNLLSSDFYKSCDACANPADIAPWKRTFNTPSKKIECYLGNLERKGIDAMPTWRQDDYVDVPAGKFKFITGRHAVQTQNATQNNVMLLGLMRENFAWINDAKAKKLGIAHGDTIEISSRVGTVRIKAYPTPKIVPDSIFYVHGFGAKSDGQTFAHRNGASDNEIIEGAIEPVYGSAIMHQTLVTVKKVSL